LLAPHLVDLDEESVSLLKERSDLLCGNESGLALGGDMVGGLDDDDGFGRPFGFGEAGDESSEFLFGTEKTDKPRSGMSSGRNIRGEIWTRRLTRNWPLSTIRRSFSIAL
jgi:hypothetical protein